MKNKKKVILGVFAWHYDHIAAYYNNVSNNNRDSYREKYLPIKNLR
jgi:predicted metallo-beta-lactamase superfamily hydrolase